MPTSPNTNRFSLGKNNAKLEAIGTRLSNTSLGDIRQQIDDSNYEIVNILSSQMTFALSLLLQTTIKSFQKVAD